MYSLAFISCTLFFADAQAAMPDATVPLEQLFGYGTEHGDQQLHNDTGTKFSAVVLDPPFKIFGEERNNATVVNNGYIEFTSGQFIIDNKYEFEHYGDAYWRNSSSRVDLSQARREIGSAFPAFQIIYLKWVLVATWYRVVHYIWYDDESTYQTILTTDGIRSFAIFYYHNSGRHTYPQVGFQLRNNYYWNTGSNADNHTNIRTPGKWIFRIDLPVIYEPNSLCHMPLHPENGFCITNEFIPGSSAQCGCHVDPIFLLTLKCLRLTDNKTVDWLGDLLTCPPIQTPIQSTGLPCPPQFPCPSCPEDKIVPASASSIEWHLRENGLFARFVRKVHVSAELSKC
ncbi:nidogen-like domain-containing protein [Ditylenchus destructor]|uniref:Nidogen-like domain-containing protein n=1 Tax=Ditylenchus destructor TaxID=166010 RepID=A0AAD4MVP7_9BILA|nr:nidogen-like domain-containing protein [Ditylenchus destructor]